ncbi:MAG: ATP-binding protein, partial [Thermomicrobiales bacterium]
MKATPAEHDSDAASAKGFFGSYLRGLRMAARLSQRELADRSGVSARTISDLERGVWRTPRADSAAMLAAALDLDAPARSVWERIIRSERPIRRRGSVTVTPLPDARYAIYGREQLLGEIIKDLSAFSGRIVTVAGAGGIGKTRIAREIAERWLADDERSGIVGWVELAGISDPADALPEIGRALGLTHLEPAATADRIADALGTSSGLLVLDNFEHLLPAAPEIAAIAAANPRHAMLVTSRQPLGVPGERLRHVPPLQLPPLRAADSTLAASPPVACFLGRAHLPQDQLASPRLVRDAARIVRLLDGMPLAIELAAAQTMLLPVAAIADLLEHGGLHLLEDAGASGAGRQRTMARTIAWSLDMLDSDARRAFRLLSVFRGGMSLSLATDLLAGGGVAHPQQALLVLIRASLLSVRDDAAGEPRYLMLEPIRLAGRMELDNTGEAAAALNLHASLMRRVSQEAHRAAVGHNPRWGFDLARRERMNLCAALDHAIVSGDDVTASNIANCLGWVWEMIEEEAQAARWFQRVVAIEPRFSSPGDRFLSATWALHYALLWRHPDQSAVARLHDLAAVTGDREHLALAHVYEAATILFFEGWQEEVDLALERAIALASNGRPSFARSIAAQVSGFIELCREHFTEAER